MTFPLSMPYGPTGITSYAQQAVFDASVMDRVAVLPGVTAVGAALRLPFNGRGVKLPELTLEAAEHPDQPAAVATVNVASAEYFRAMGLSLVAGRTFRAGDLRGTPGMILSERLAGNLFGSTNAVGRIVTRRATAGFPARPFSVIGVVADVHQDRIEDGYVPTAYFPLLRDNDGFPADSVVAPFKVSEVQFVVRATQQPSEASLRAIMQSLDKRIPPTNMRTLESLVADATARVRLTMLLIAVAGGAALLLGVIGVYSVVSYAATGRAREFGIRLALGAAPRRVGSIVLGDGLRIVSLGAGFGLVAALAATRFLRALLYQVEPTSAAEFIAATVLLVSVTAIATALPARRAARTDPSLVLRGE
jgi:putative ABC transport system permease protein